MDLVEEGCIGDMAGSPFGQRRDSWLENIWRTDTKGKEFVLFRLKGDRAASGQTTDEKHTSTVEVEAGLF